MRKHFICLCVALLFLSSNLQAQTATLAWEYDKLPSEVSQYVQSITIDGTVQTAVPTCAALGTTRTACSIPAPSLATGTHSVSISATRGGITATTNITGIGGTGAPSNPSNPKVVITITVSVGGQ